MCFSPYLGVGGEGGGGLPRGLGRNLLMQFSRLNSSKMEITSQRLLDQSQAGVYRGNRHIPPILGLFAYPMMSFWSGPPQTPPT